MQKSIRFHLWWKAICGDTIKNISEWFLLRNLGIFVNKKTTLLLSGGIQKLINFTYPRSMGHWIIQRVLVREKLNTDIQQVTNEWLKMQQNIRKIVWLNILNSIAKPRPSFVQLPSMYEMKITSLIAGYFSAVEVCHEIMRQSVDGEVFRLIFGWIKKIIIEIITIAINHISWACPLDYLSYTWAIDCWFSPAEKLQFGFILGKGYQKTLFPSVSACR